MDEREKGTNEYAIYLVSMLNSGINIEPNKNKNKNVIKNKSKK